MKLIFSLAKVPNNERERERVTTWYKHFSALYHKKPIETQLQVRAYWATQLNNGLVWVIELLN